MSTPFPEPGQQNWGSQLKQAVLDRLAGRASLVGGKVPDAELPDRLREATLTTTIGTAVAKAASEWGTGTDIEVNDATLAAVLGDSTSASRQTLAAINVVRGVVSDTPPPSPEPGMVWFNTGAPWVWTPARLPGLAAWYDAQSLALGAGAAVSSWTDKSGNGRHLTQGTAAAQPKYQPAGVLGRPSVQFDGTDDHLTATTDSYTGPWTVYLVAQKLNTTTGALIDATEGGGSLGTRLAYMGGSTNWLLTRGTILTGPAVDTLPHRHRLVFDGNNSSIRVDGAAPVTGNTGSGTTSDGLLMGCRLTGGSLQQFFAGHICEAVYVRGLVSPGDDARVSEYLTKKWSL